MHTPGMNAQEAQISVQDYLAIIIRRRWYFVIPAAVIVVASTVFGMFLPKIYQAETKLLMQDPKIMNPLIQGMAVSTPVQTRMRLVKEELLGWTSVSRLVAELGLDRHAKSPLEFERIVKELRRGINVKMSGSLIRLTYEHEDPAMAQQVLNTVTNIYIQRNVESQTAEAETAIRFIESEMEVYKTKLEDSERALREFKELYAMEMPVAAKLNQQIIELEVRLAQLLVENTDEHPVVVQLRRQIQDMKRNRNEEVKRVIATAIAKGQNPEVYEGFLKAIDQPAAASAPATPDVQAAKDAYSAWVQRLDSPATGGPVTAPTAPAAPSSGEEEGEAPAVTDDLGAMSITLGPRQEQELARLRRDYNIHANTYEQMKRRLERARVTQRLGESDEGTKFKIIEPARLPLKPVRPNVWVIFTTSLMVGLFVGVCVAFGAEYLDQSFQSADDVQAALALPVLGSISTIVTEADLTDRRRRVRSWMSYRDQWERVHRRVVHPVWERIDQALLRWGL